MNLIHLAPYQSPTWVSLTSHQFRTPLRTGVDLVYLTRSEETQLRNLLAATFPQLTFAIAYDTTDLYSINIRSAYNELRVELFRDRDEYYYLKTKARPLRAPFHYYRCDQLHGVAACLAQLPLVY